MFCLLVHTVLVMNLLCEKVEIVFSASRWCQVTTFMMENNQQMWQEVQSWLSTEGICVCILIFVIIVGEKMGYFSHKQLHLHLYPLILSNLRSSMCVLCYMSGLEEQHLSPLYVHIVDKSSWVESFIFPTWLLCVQPAFKKQGGVRIKLNSLVWQLT